MPAQASARDSCRSSRAPVEGLQPPQMNLLRQSSKARTSRHQPTKYDVKGGSLGRPAFLLRVNLMKVFSKLKEEFFKILPLSFGRILGHPDRSFRAHCRTSDILRTDAYPASMNM